jgi:hypothetical protein
MVKKEVLVRKASGVREPYDPKKVRKAVIRAGANETLADQIMSELEKKLYNGIKTDKIFRIVFQLLRKHHPHSASRYDLKRAIMKIGPAGYPFETFFSEVLEEYGYDTKLRQIVQGRCVPHEIDVIAKNKEGTFMIECKYHNNRGTKSHVHDGLYTWARFLDLQEGAKEGKCQEFDQAWLVTNTKFTTEVVEYANCRGLKLVGWNYPRDTSIRHLIENKNIYPISILRSIDRYTMKRLLYAELTLVKDLLKFPIRELQSKTRVSRTRLETIVAEAKGVVRAE